MPEKRLIGVVVTGERSFYRGMIRGIARYAHQHPEWNVVFLKPEPSRVTLRALQQVQVAIATIGNHAWCDALLGSGVPLIHIDAVIPDLAIPRLCVDDRELGRLAASHFLERGLNSFGFVGQRNLLFSRERELTFQTAISEAGFDVAIFTARGDRALGPISLARSGRHDLGTWLLSLPKPVGILAPEDLWGLEIVEVCRQVNLRVPEDVAVLGVDNDDLFCGISSPPLSSIILPTEAMGFRAAEEADRIIDSNSSGLTQDILFPPLGIAVRKSTDVFSIDDPHVIQALKFIQANCHRPIRVADVMRQVPISRRWLERRMLDLVGVTLGGQIRRSRLDRAKQLLMESDLPIADVAVRCGYTDLRHIEMTFRSELDCTPSQFRQEARGLRGRLGASFDSPGR